MFSPSRVHPHVLRESVCKCWRLFAQYFFDFVFASSWLICLLRCAFVEPFSDTTLWNFLQICARRLGVVWGLQRFSPELVRNMSFHLPRCLFVCFLQFGVFFTPLGPLGKYVKHGVLHAFGQERKSTRRTMMRRRAAEKKEKKRKKKEEEEKQKKRKKRHSAAEQTKNGKSRWDAQEERLQHEAPRGTATTGRRPPPPPARQKNPHLCEKPCFNR